MNPEPPLRLLLVDDKPENLTALRAVLADMGPGLVTASSGADALRQALVHDFAVILIDVQMPGMNGFETAACIRERERSRQTPIIFLTAALKTDEMVSRGYSVGAVDYMIKPIVPQILRAKVQVFVDLAATRKKMEQEIAERQRAEMAVGQLNQELVARAALLEAANQELEAFSYSVSHDLRSPLRHIDGFCNLLKQRSAASLDSQSHHYIKVISDSAKRMGHLIDDLLAFSRAGRAELRQTTVNLEHLVQEVKRGLQLEMQDRDILWKNGSLPQVRGDSSLLRQVFVNLISNAIKYTRPRRPAQIEIGCLTDNPKEIVIFVRDNGVGFDMEYADKLFGVFQRLHRAEEFEGTGVGLANVRRIIHRHGGQTWAEGKIGEGATFYFSLPVAAAPCGTQVSPA